MPFLISDHLQAKHSFNALRTLHFYEDLNAVLQKVACQEKLMMATTNMATKEGCRTWLVFCKHIY